MSKNTILIGGASGFWGDAAHATSQLLAVPGINYIVYDYLAEITMSIMARARAREANKGYASDFTSVAMAPNLRQIAEQGVKIISNAGGVNPQACTQTLRTIIKQQGLNLNVACVLGDDLMSRVTLYESQGVTEMFSNGVFPDAEQIQSINAYLGAFPIAAALAEDADIVITGRCVDSAVTLGACIHEFNWYADELDKLAMGSLAGHILECGPQATGGNFTDWHLVADSLHNIGYPIVEIQAEGGFVCSKPENTGGLVSVGTVAEQMLYEIGDPQAYILPDVVCDFSEVRIQEIAPDRVAVSGAKGRGVPESYKVCATYADEFRGGTFFTFYGIDAESKARAFADAVFRACARQFAKLNLPDFTETSIEVIGSESQFGEYRQMKQAREVAIKIAAKHPQAAGITALLREAVGLGLATPPGLSGFQGSRPKPSPVVRLFSFLIDKDEINVQLEIGGQSRAVELPGGTSQLLSTSPHPPPPLTQGKKQKQVKLVDLAWARSGDKGDKANIGVIARKSEYYPYIVEALTEKAVQNRLQHFLAESSASRSGKAVERFLLPGTSALNFLCHSVLGGGGVASIRNDAQGKGYAQLLLEMPVSIDAQLEVKNHAGV